ncbi:MAG TPA: DNA repair protein RecN [Desulfobacteraceae bacterium]|nr:DNA repair protein RecN [Desulfobacteraceae bacterium]
MTVHRPINVTRVSLQLESGREQEPPILSTSFHQVFPDGNQPGSCMLDELHISDFAIITDLKLSLKPGLNTLTGETGAGKSIIINAMNLLLGGRASSDLIRTGCKEARVGALFSISEQGAVAAVLEEMGCTGDGELLIQRTINREGRNKVFINGSIATLSMLSKIGGMLINISGQHENQVLLRPDNHLFLLDEFGRLSDRREMVKEMYESAAAVEAEMNELKTLIKEGEVGRDLAMFQIREIDAANLQPDEDEQLAEERRRLQHAEELLAALAEAYDLLYESDGSVVSRLSQSSRKVARASEIDGRLTRLHESLEEFQAGIEDIAFALRDARRKVENDPGRLAEVEERIAVLNEMKRKYGGSIASVLSSREQTAARLFDAEELQRRLKAAQERLETLAESMRKEAAALSTARRESAARLEALVERELAQLHMENTRFRVSVQVHGERIGPDGMERVEFFISTNVGEEMKPLAKIASGGELSRLMLSLKKILAGTASVETLIFDEVDSGISGATAEVVGEKLRGLAAYHQILCITHLPQIASQAETHFLVKKAVAGGRTRTAITELDRNERVTEIARMLAGREITEGAVTRAREMLS